ncbi:hypothetical protein JCM8097_001942 [Rhodosporidiobolus ruineniae]
MVQPLARLARRGALQPLQAAVPGTLNAPPIRVDLAKVTRVLESAARVLQVVQETGAAPAADRPDWLQVVLTKIDEADEKAKKRHDELAATFKSNHNELIALAKSDKEEVLATLAIIQEQLTAIAVMVKADTARFDGVDGQLGGIRTLLDALRTDFTKLMDRFADVDLGKRSAELDKLCSSF